MELTEHTGLNLLINDLQPNIRVEDGDVIFEKLENHTIYLGAHAECAKWCDS